MPIEDPSSAASLGGAEMDNAEHSQLDAAAGGGAAPAANNRSNENLIWHHHGRQYRPKAVEKAVDKIDLKGTSVPLRKKLGTQLEEMKWLGATAAAAALAASDDTAELYGEEPIQSNLDIKTADRCPPDVLCPAKPRSSPRGVAKTNAAASTDQVALVDAAGRSPEVKKENAVARKKSSPRGLVKVEAANVLCPAKPRSSPHGVAKTNVAASTDQVALVDATGRSPEVKKENAVARKKSSPRGSVKVEAATDKDDVLNAGYISQKVNRASAFEETGEITNGCYQGGFIGKVICLLGFSPQSYEKVGQKIGVLGGSAVPAAEYSVSSHICIGDDPAGKNVIGVKVVTRDWIERCHSCVESSKGGQSGKSNRKKSETAIKKLDFDISMKNHQLFFCPYDQSTVQGLPDLISHIKRKKVTMITPGCISLKHLHKSIVTSDELKVVVKMSYVLVKALHRAGLCLEGNFEAKNFVVDEARGEKNLRFTGLTEESIKSDYKVGRQLDWTCFDCMVRNEFFGEDIPGHDLNLWLTLLDNEELSDLMPDHVSLMPLCEQTDKFVSLYAELSNLSSDLYDTVLDHLSGYAGWKAIFSEEKNNKTEYNFILSTTLRHVSVGDDGEKKEADYSDDIRGLLRLLRNNSQHDSFKERNAFSLIVGHHFPNLIADLQKEMYLACKKSAEVVK